MADRYWVAGGTGNYNSNTNWSATSGGASGASVPLAADDVFFNANSGAGIATVNVASNCRSLNLTGFTGTIQFNFNLSLNGTILNLGTGGYTIAGTANLRLATGMTITSNGTIYQGNFEIGGTGTYTLTDDLTINGITTISSGGAQNLNGNNLYVNSDLLVTSISSGSTSGTTNIILSGTGTWSSNQTNTNSGQITNNLIINTTGTITILGNVWKGGGTISYVAGTVISTSGTLIIGRATLVTNVDLGPITFEKILVAGGVNLLSDINATTFGTATIGVASSITFTLNTFNLNFTHLDIRHNNNNAATLPNAWVCQNIEFSSTSGSTTNGFSITINGDIIQSGNGVISGSTNFIYAGTGTWSQTGTGRIAASLTINTAGTLNFIKGSVGGGIFTYTAGTIITTGSTLHIRAAGQVMNHGSIVWDNVMIGSGDTLGTGGITTLVLNNQLICLGTLTLNLAATSFSGTDGTFDTYNLLLGTDTSALRTTTLASTKTYRVRQSFICTLAASASRVLLRSSVGASQAIFTLDQGAAIDVGFVDATDIDSSLGRRIYSYRGVFSNTLNWDLLPTDVKPATGVFVN